MLVLKQRQGEQIILDLRKHGLGLVEIHTVDITGWNVRLGFTAHPEVLIYRREVFNEIEAGKKAGSAT